jgi:ATP-dependent Clp protease protease subunit
MTHKRPRPHPIALEMSGGDEGAGDNSCAEEEEEEEEEECGHPQRGSGSSMGRVWRDLSSRNAAIFRAGTRVTFFSPVTPVTTARLLALVQEACELVLRGRRTVALGLNPAFEDGCVELHISSDGGDAFAGLTAYDMLRRMQVPTRGVVCGSCCSAATLIMMGCTERCGLPHSFLLLHEVRTEMQGSCAEVRVDLENTDMLAKAYRDIYRDGSNMSEEQVRREMAHEGMIGAERARELGLLHRILAPTRALPRGQRMTFVPSATFG